MRLFCSKVGLSRKPALVGAPASGPAQLRFSGSWLGSLPSLRLFAPTQPTAARLLSKELKLTGFDPASLPERTHRPRGLPLHKEPGFFRKSGRTRRPG